MSKNTVLGTKSTGGPRCAFNVDHIPLDLTVLLSNDEVSRTCSLTPTDNLASVGDISGPQNLPAANMKRAGQP